LGSERVTRMLKTPQMAARSGPKSTSLSKTTLSDAVEYLLGTSVNKASEGAISGKVRRPRTRDPGPLACLRA
jgi:hypothetical protein